MSPNDKFFYVEGENERDQLGSMVALSADGYTFATGAPGSNGGFGMMKIFMRGGNDWFQKGSSIVGEGVMDTIGGLKRIAISGDGNIVAVSAYFADGDAGSYGQAGYVRIFQYMKTPK